jgi:DNA polymerase III delta subunit
MHIEKLLSRFYQDTILLKRLRHFKPDANLSSLLQTLAAVSLFAIQRVVPLSVHLGNPNVYSAKLMTLFTLMNKRRTYSSAYP